MNTTLRITAMLAAAAASFGPGAGSAQNAPVREITNVTGNLYRFRETRHYGVFLVTSDGIVVVDPANPALAGWLKSELDRRFGLPVRYVVYSHAHNDHASGGQVFADTATFVGHENMRRNLQKPPADAPLLPREQLWDANGNGRIELSEANGYAAQAFQLLGIDERAGLRRTDIWEVRFGGGNIVPPDIYYADRMTIALGGKTVELQFFGLGHTDDMSVVLFPEERTIYTVDALTPERLPFEDLDGTFLPEWLEWLRHVDTLDFDIIAPGHEDLGTKADVAEQIAYMRDLVDAVETGIAAGRSKQELVDSVLLEQYSHMRAYEAYRASNVAGAYEILVSSRP
ncbi:MAG TPA: MBL fold metallo-hydrolase [Gammaproteobacteria bacterium]|nr:MBL fold metallo-hydrolase [Gammaproteobacteria bacterium]